ncbi:baseplate J/gp47 family protein [Kitasatospora sp. A2-31]|uniref:baseplate J/gp47 family protein n=1 Tax=Kitasatospora sp. A2-31 TaxID=2916414 RepID=UPI001EEAE770|nr:baseplate J/gp47 family protein [Kitasatospora sp. A2-31]MCG6495450.1 baseplate J/gp47 family protein [Kitasatospora sp. A2-31]
MAQTDGPPAGGTPGLPVRRPENLPGRGRLDYRLGTFETFRRAMLDDLPLQLPGWHETESAPDRATALVDAWAYLADSASFYAELVANEAFIGTATQLDSLQRLARLVGYRPGPGAAARVLLALTVDPARAGQEVTVRQGTRVGGRAAPDRLPVVFETDQAVTARTEHNSIPLASAGPADQFAPLGALAAVEALTTPGAPGPPAGEVADFNRIANDLGLVFPLLAGALLQTGRHPAPGRPPTPPPDPAEQALPDATSGLRRTVHIVGTGLRLRAGGYVLVFDRFDGDGVPTGEGLLRELAEVREDRRAGRTALTWVEDGTVYATTPGTAPAVYALRATALPFGAAAPRFADMPQPPPQGLADWDTGDGRWLPEEAFVLHLDTVVAAAAAGSEADPRFAVLLDVSGTRRPYRTFRLTGADTAMHLAFAVRGLVTRLRLASAVPAKRFLRRATTVLLCSQRLPLDDRRPLPEPLGGDRLLLAGRYPALTPGQSAVVTSTVAGERGESTLTEAVAVEEVRVLDASDLTLVTLRAPLIHVHQRSRTALLGNVVAASHGETTPAETLGSGDGTAWQAFRLRRGPLTYLPDSEGMLRSTLQVSVNGVRWTERDTPADAGAAEGAAFTVEHPPGDTPGTVVRFGDGGSRPPTGRDNVVATYRCGLGSEGAVPPGGVTRLVDAVPGLRAVTNPLPAEGAADPETADGIRRNAPASLRTLGRAVSVSDHTELALAFPGIARARASTAPAGGEGLGLGTEIRLTVARADRQPLTGDHLTRLRRYLDARRDVNQPLRIVDFTPVPADVTVVVDLDDRYGRRPTLAAVRAALAQRTGPDGNPGHLATLGFGEALRVSGVYAAAQAVPGVTRVVVTRLCAAGTTGGPALLDVLPVPATGLVLVADDPADGAGLRGRLTVLLGTGGFAE